MMARGFTLLELLVVLAVLGLLAAMAMPVKPPKASAANAARLLAGDLARARTQAIARNEEMVVVFDVDARTWQGAGSMGKLPPHLRLAITAAATEGAAIRFYPEGGASGGHISVLGGGRAEIAVDWLTGGVTVDAR
jgi:general secretion pathway protein H